MYGYSGQQCCVKDVSSIFYFETQSSHPLEGAGSNHTQYHFHHQKTVNALNDCDPIKKICSFKLDFQSNFKIT